MEIPDQLQTLFSGQIDEQDGTYVVEVPEREIEIGDLQHGRTYRVAMLQPPTTDGADETGTGSDTESTQERGPPDPPVDEGEQRTVEIEDLGEQGDGITRVERGFVVIVPDTEQGERATVEITDVRENVAFAEVVERLSYYD
jgi:predicted RNA-binding protein with TRAM domain